MMTGTERTDLLDGAYDPSSVARVREQVAAYEATDGAEGGTLEGRPVVILTSVGASSGKVRKTPLMRIPDGDRYVLVASAAGAPTHPAWYYNLLAHPYARLQDGGRIREFTAREVTADEKARYWQIAERNWPHFPAYRRSAGSRDIPILVLEPDGADSASLIASRNKALVIGAFDTLFNRRDYAAARKLWSPHYIQHSAHIAPGREGLFSLVESLPEDLRYEHRLVAASGDCVLLHGRFSNIGQPVNWVVVDIVRVAGGMLAEHWDVIQDEASRDDSRSGLPMFGDEFPVREAGVAS